MLEAKNIQPQLNVYFLPIPARSRHFYIRIFLCFLPMTFLLKVIARLFLVIESLSSYYKFN